MNLVFGCTGVAARVYPPRDLLAGGGGKPPISLSISENDHATEIDEVHHAVVLLPISSSPGL
jgi:hypothetical protein